MIVMMMASTPSLKASSRVLPNAVSPQDPLRACMAVQANFQRAKIIRPAARMISRYASTGSRCDGTDHVRHAGLLQEGKLAVPSWR
jgi:hypothetical protein